MGHPEEEMLSVYRDHGVVQKESRIDNFNKTAENRNIYQLVDTGWLIVNRMKAWQGSLGVSPYRGIVSGHYICFRPKHREDDRFLNYSLRSAPYTAELRRLSRGVRPNQIEIDNDGLRVLPVRLPGLPMQRAIADYLDAGTARIDALIAKKERMIDLLSEYFDSAVFKAITQGLHDQARRPSRLSWVGEIPVGWGTPAVSVNFELQLGKMLSAEAADGPEQHPYVRNVNVQWDRIDLDDLATMQFNEADRRRCELREGDLLVCEGGEVGRAAVWPGAPSGVFFQKAIHRVRPRGGANSRFLMYCLRAAAKMNVFAVEGNLSTIVHLTGEQLSVHRFPWPSVDEQSEIVEALDRLRDRGASATSALTRQVALLQEHKQALITAAVTGGLEVPGVAA